MSGWEPVSGGATLGGVGTEGGSVYVDEEHPTLGLRLTLEGDAARDFWAVTCGVSGWMVHTRFFSTEAQARAALEEMRPALEALAGELVAGGQRPGAPGRVESGAKLAAFTARFP